VAFSPDGARIVSGGEDGTVRLWTLDGKPAAEPFKGHARGVRGVAFSPDGKRIVSGGEDGTVRLWTLDGKPAAEPFEGNAGWIESVAFSPDGTRIVCGGGDGTVRLWTLDGKPAAGPLEGHARGVLGHLHGVASVAFSPDGTRIVSGGEDGTVRLSGIAARTASTLYYCRADLGLGFVDKRFFWIGCSDRISIQSAAFEPRGELFLNKEGLFASVYSEGANVPNDRLQEPFRAIAADAHVIWQRHAVAEVSVERVRQVLLDDWTLRERVYDFARRAYTLANEWYAHLAWWGKASFWPALGWLIAILTAVGTWIFVPHKLSSWAMRSVGRPELPTWKWLASFLTLFSYLGTTRRPLRAWLRKNRDALYEQNFTGRTPVKEREKFCNLTHDGEIAEFTHDTLAGSGARVWITGVGGSGKSALAYRMLRIAAEHKASAPLPILVDEDWDGALLDQVVQLVRVDNRIPTPKMVEVLGAGGDLCLLIDLLSERSMADAVDRVANAVGKRLFKSIVVTSRQPRPSGHVWQAFKPIIALPLTPAEVPDYVATYAPADRRIEVSQQIAPLITANRLVSPLFLRFAIEQALVGQVTSTSTLDLVVQYVEALRAGRLDLSADDMLRAASVAATEAVRESLVPRETEQAYLRGVLVKEADVMAFMNANNNGSIDPAAMIEMLVECGLLNRNRTNRRLQFAYDPVAEQLAARMTAEGRPGTGVAPLKDRILSEPDSAIARAMAEIETSLRPRQSEPQSAGLSTATQT
jgi:hypothetical protein